MRFCGISAKTNSGLLRLNCWAQGLPMLNEHENGTNSMKDSGARLVAIYVLVAVLVWAVGYGFDRLLVRDGVSRSEVLLLSNGLTGLAAAYLFYSLASN